MRKISMFGSLLLFGAISFPYLSNAMELSFVLDNQINIERRDTEYLKQQNKDTEFNTKKSNNNQSEEYENRANEKRQNQYKEDHDNRDKSRFGFFSNWWDKVRQKNKNTQSSSFLNEFKIKTDNDDVRIDWSTDNESEGSFTYSTSSNFVSATVINLDSDNKHSIELGNLESNTTYYYKILLDTDEDSEIEITKTGSFITEEKNDYGKDDESSTLLWIHTSFVEENSAKINWITPQKSTDKVWIEDSSSIDTSKNPNYIDSSLSFFHTIQVEDLEAGTTYHFKIASTDNNGHTSISSLQSFTTKVE